VNRVVPARPVLLPFAAPIDIPLQELQILRFMIKAALRAPKLMVAAALAVLAALAGTMSYTGFLVVGVLADHLGTGRFLAGLLLAVLFARFPWIRQGRLRVVGLIPGPARRPLVVVLLALCSLDMLSRADYVATLFTGFATAFVLGYPWLKRAVVGRLLSSVSRFAGRQPSGHADDTVIDGEFRERKD
jgi:hypothetical protein